MIIRPSQLRPIPSFLLPFQQTRCLHQRMPAPRIPPPTPFVPDPQTFLTLIGRNLSQHAAKIPTWEALFSLTSPQLKDLGIEPPRARKYLLRWREKFRKGQYGIGGDLQFVTDGEATVKVLEVPRKSATIATATTSPGMAKVILNVGEAGLGEAPVKGLRVKGAHTIVGPYVLPVKGTDGMEAKIKVAEGMWEDRRGHKIDGGERRRAEVRAKRRSEENKR